VSALAMADICRKALLLWALTLPALSLAATDHVRLDPAPIDIQDVVSIQRGAKVFVNYCLTCHSAKAMRYSQLTQLGLTEEQVRENLMFTTDKIGEPMTVALRAADAKEWFGVVPPDLSVIARSRSPDWLYTFLRSYYRDDETATGWNNVVFENVAMPHVLWGLQGQQVLKAAEQRDAHGAGPVKTLVSATPGTLSEREYNGLVADLVNYLVYMSEPNRAKRVQIGYAVLLALAVLFVLFYLLKREYWKDVH
jgi:ubiquinol-cytochrome c reductase cytochrome c1 subunit